MKILKYQVTVEVPNKTDPLENYRQIRDAIFNLKFTSTEVVPIMPNKKEKDA
jgi:hypothetical protein